MPEWIDVATRVYQQLLILLLLTASFPKPALAVPLACATRFFGERSGWKSRPSKWAAGLFTASAKKVELAVESLQERTYLVWEELLPESSNLARPQNDDLDDDAVQIEGQEASQMMRPSLKRKRPLVWWSSTEEWLDHQQTSDDTRSSVATHPLRTDQWQLRIRWRRVAHDKLPWPNPLQLEFADNGYVRIQRSSNEEDTAFVENETMTPSGNWMGTWKLTSSGLSWSLPLNEQGNLWYIFHAHLHLHPFGDHPKLSRGLILRSQVPGPDLDDEDMDSITHLVRHRVVPWWRPVVATFTGMGVGRDMVDLSYQSRNLGT